MMPLREIVDGIQSQISKIEDDLKVIHVNVLLILFVGYLLFEGRYKEQLLVSKPDIDNNVWLRVFEISGERISWTYKLLYNELCDMVRCL